MANLKDKVTRVIEAIHKHGEVLVYQRIANNKLVDGICCCSMGDMKAMVILREHPERVIGVYDGDVMPEWVIDDLIDVTSMRPRTAQPKPLDKYT